MVMVVSEVEATEMKFYIPPEVTYQKSDYIWLKRITKVEHLPIKMHCEGSTIAEARLFTMYKNQY